jgi:hypothetical protein
VGDEDPESPDRALLHYLTWLQDGLVGVLDEILVEPGS